MFQQVQLDDELDLTDYQRISRVQVALPGDTMELGRPNKHALRTMISDFQVGRDIMQVVSCLDPGERAAAADRRTLRISEELVLYGIAPNTIINDQCSPQEYGKAKKKRAVAIVHRRRTSGEAIVTTKKLPKEYPTRPLVLTIPYGAGGATDFQARIVTMLSGSDNVLGQPMVIVNKPGAGGRNGWSWFTETAGIGGYDLAVFNLPHFIAQCIKFKDVPYNIDTLEPIAAWGADPAVLIVPLNSPFKTVEDLVKFARSHPGKLTINGAGLFVGHHIATLQLEKSANISLDYVTEKGGAAALEAVVKEAVMAGMNNMSDAYRARDSVRILAIADMKRNKEFLPGVATFLEQGLAIDDSSVNFRGLMVPKGTPPEVVDKLEKAAKKMFNDDFVRIKMAEGGSQLTYISSAEVLTMWAERQHYLEGLLKRL